MQTPELIINDPWLEPFTADITGRIDYCRLKEEELTQNSKLSLSEISSNHLYMGLHSYDSDSWVIREWAPNANKIFLTGEFSNWQTNNEYLFSHKKNGIWELIIPKKVLPHKSLYKLHIFWPGGDGYRIPVYANRVVQDEKSLLFNSQVWHPDSEFNWTDSLFSPNQGTPIIYEAHIGMSSTDNKVASYKEFKEDTLPRIIKAGYNTIQLMAIQEHPYYGSFGYHVSNFFAASSRFGTPEELKELINEAHKNGISVIMDIVHSHAVKNELEGLSCFDGSYNQYFHSGDRGNHPAWDSRCFDYGKNEVLTFLLSNCRYWLEEYHFDGYRFDGVTSMLYYDHGLGKSFSSYQDYFSGGEDIDAVCYLYLANKLIHSLNSNYCTVAEEMSGMPGLAAPIEKGGIGFDYRLSMGIPDFWIKMIKEKSDENWNVGEIYHELSQHRQEEKTISYCESHDQALVGDKTIVFRLLDKEMYDSMSKHTPSLIVDRGLSLHKIIRLLTIGTHSGGYLNFMGNEFGHPEWIDFPREGNNWSYHYARRQWNLMDDKELKYHLLSDFDQDLITLMTKEDADHLNYSHSIVCNESDQILVFTRGDLIFVINLNPSTSFTDYGFNIEAGKYKIVLNSDNPKYGGFGNIDENYIYYSEKIPYTDNHQLKLYLPSRTAFILKKQTISKVY